MDLIKAVMDFEDGTMEQEDLIPFFQELIDTGMAWQLQGAYGRAAAALIERGLCHEGQ